MEPTGGTTGGTTGGPDPLHARGMQTFEALVSSSQDAIIGVETAGLIATWNPGAERLFGYSWHEAIGRPLSMLFPTQGSEPEWDTLDRALAGEPIGHYETQWRHRARVMVDVSVSFSPIHNGGDRIVGASVVAFDNTRGRAALAEMASDMRHLRKGFDNAPIGMALVKPDGSFVEVNDSLCRLLGYAREELLATTFQALTDPDDLPEELAYVHQVLTGRTHGYHMEKRFLSADRGPVWVLLSCSSVNATQPLPDFLLLQMEDVTARKASEDFLLHRALHDPLTDLPNRVLLHDRTAQAIAFMGRRGTLVAVLFLDLDRFKAVNDRYGHEIGDHLLITVAGRLRAITRPQDTVARLGGDEFVMLCEGFAREDELLAFARRVVDTLSAPMTFGDVELVSTISLGVATASTDGDDPGTVLGNADAALYRAKAAGGNRIEIFDAEMRGRATNRLALEMNLHRGIDAGELRLAYQVLVDLTTGTIRAVEALVRWEHPARGRLLPADFLPVAEASGLIVAVGRWVRQAACTQGALWNQDPKHPVTICINASQRELSEPGFADGVLCTLESTGLAPNALCLELTENVLLEGESAHRACVELAEAGVQLAIDRFGTGYSSFGYFTRFPVSWLKIEQGFVRGMAAYRVDAAIVGAAIRLAEGLGLDSVGEGVESEQQVIDLRASGCRMAQGFYFGEPSSAEVVGALIARRGAERGD
ncbi:MAG TPA: EAL domain-containing protein [Actinomycetota bacterium]|nr:EAL domain-containing protein [Actinomycetota bacterium]